MKIRIEMENGVSLNVDERLSSKILSLIFEKSDTNVVNPVKKAVKRGPQNKSWSRKRIKWTPEMLNRLSALYEKNVPFHEIGKELNVSEASAYFKSRDLIRTGYLTKRKQMHWTVAQSLKNSETGAVYSGVAVSA